jgi:vancomycin resistance protein YoaR
VAENTSPESYSGRTRRSSRVPERNTPIYQQPAVLAGVVLALVVVLAVGVDAFASAGRVHPGTRVYDISVGGMRPAEAAATLRTALPAKTSQPVTVTYADKTWQVAPGDIGLSFDYDAIVNGAMAVGREPSFGKALSSRVAAWFGGRNLEVTPTVSAEMMDATLNGISKGIDKPAVNADVAIHGTRTSVVPSKDGVGLLRDKAAAAIVSAFFSANRKVEAPIGALAAKISDAAAADAKGKVDKMLASGVAVSFGDQRWDFTPQDVAGWIKLRAVESTSGAAQLEPYISAEETSKTLSAKLGGMVGTPARDAAFKTRNGEVVIIPSQEGVGPDVEALATDLTDLLLKTETDRAVALRMRTTQPKLTTEEARSYGIKERISTFTTAYAASNKPRVNNVHLLGDALDGKLIAPGAVFSFNGAVGERTAAKGYQEANAIVDGKLVPQLGGGICQVGTTLFNTIFESGLPVLQRSNHSFYISHYPKGRDATVSWGGPDLKFKNDTPNWVLISVSYTSSSITISLYGTDPGYTVTSVAGPWTDVKPFPTEEVQDATLYAGMKVIEDMGETGRKIVVTRTVTKGGQVVRTDQFMSNYKPKVQVVRVGTKPRVSKTATGTVPATSTAH